MAFDFSSQPYKEYHYLMALCLHFGLSQNGGTAALKKRLLDEGIDITPITGTALYNHYQKVCKDNGLPATGTMKQLVERIQKKRGASLVPPAANMSQVPKSHRTPAPAPTPVPAANPATATPRPATPVTPARTPVTARSIISAGTKKALKWGFLLIWLLICGVGALFALALPISLPQLDIAIVENPILFWGGLTPSIVTLLYAFFVKTRIGVALVRMFGNMLVGIGMWWWIGYALFAFSQYGASFNIAIITGSTNAIILGGGLVAGSIMAVLVSILLAAQKRYILMSLNMFFLVMAFGTSVVLGWWATPAVETFINFLK